MSAIQDQSGLANNFDQILSEVLKDETEFNLVVDKTKIKTNSKTTERYDEPIFQPEKRRTIFPIKFQGIWDKYKEQRALGWEIADISLIRDKDEWNLMKPEEKHFIKMVLAFFANSDLIVNNNLDKRFLNEVEALEVRFAYDFQKSMENVHSEMYALLIDLYSENQEEKNKLQNAVDLIPSIGKMAKWAEHWMNSNRHFEERLFAFACYEGILFSGPFCAIYWLRQRGVLPGLCSSNNLIARDEGKHVETAVEVHKALLNKCPEEIARDILKEVVRLEIEFITESLPCKLIGINSKLMTIYIKFVSNRLMEQFGFEKVYRDIENPFPFIDRICMDNKTNFFEKRVTEYNRAETDDKDVDPYAIIQ